MGGTNESANEVFSSVFPSSEWKARWLRREGRSELTSPSTQTPEIEKGQGQVENVEIKEFEVHDERITPSPTNVLSLAFPSISASSTPSSSLVVETCCVGVDVRIPFTIHSIPIPVHIHVIHVLLFTIILFTLVAL